MVTARPTRDSTSEDEGASGGAVRVGTETAMPSDAACCAVSSLALLPPLSLTLLLDFSRLWSDTVEDLSERLAPLRPFFAASDSLC